jgi:DNA-binding NarL/FixJ family response regulator
MHDLFRPVRVVIQHADPLVAAGAAAALAGQPGIAVLQPRSDASPAWSDAQVMVCDYDGGLAWLACQRSAQREGAAAPGVLVVSWRDSEAEIRDALQEGVRGYLLGGCSLDELVMAVRALGRGAHHLCETAACLVAQSLTRTPLTSRETEVLRLIASGLPNKLIASRLDIAVGTVKAHTKAILAKLDAGSRTEATVIAEQRGLLGPRASLPSAGALREQARSLRSLPVRERLAA